jgi:hypothetical protein
MSRRRRLLILATVLLALYVGSYLILSRRGFIRDGYFFPPQETASWRVCNYRCVAFYSPLILIDNLLGTGKRPAACSSPSMPTEIAPSAAS